MALVKLRALGGVPGRMGEGGWASGKAAGDVESLTGLIPPHPPHLLPPQFPFLEGVDHPVCLAGLLQGRVEVVLCESRLGIFTLGWWGRHCGYGSPQLPRRPVPLCSPFPALPCSLLSGQPRSPPPVLACLPPWSRRWGGCCLSGWWGCPEPGELSSELLTMGAF